VTTKHETDESPGGATTGRSPQIDPRFAEFRRTCDRELRNRIVEDHRWLSEHCARRYVRRGEPLDDLVQVALLGLVKAVDRFDPDRGCAFSTFAVPTILGELRRYFRDSGWATHVPRRVKELCLVTARATEALEQDLGRSPTTFELADVANLPVADVLEANAAARSYRVGSLRPVGADEDTSDMQPLLAEEEAGFDRADAHDTVQRLLDLLPDRERRIVELRFLDEMSQGEIAAQVGVSQVHVSRLLRRTFERLRRELSDGAEPLATAHAV
jgi:RNA polymerase sigma-B factor